MDDKLHEVRLKIGNMFEDINGIKKLIANISEVAQKPSEDVRQDEEVIKSPRESKAGENFCQKLEAADFQDAYLPTDLLSLMTRRCFADVTIHCASEIFEVHKCVLSARSPVFEAMLTSPDGIDKVVIEDIEPATFKGVLIFIYSGHVFDLCVPSACNLLHAAENYQIKGLKKVCVRYLQCNLILDNCFSILRCADMCDEELKSDAISYISTHFLDLRFTDDWNQLQADKPQMALQVYSAVVEMLLQKSK